MDDVQEHQAKGINMTQIRTSAVAASMSAVGHNHRGLPGVLRYRGLENEAVKAARLVKIGSLFATLQSVLDNLDATMGVWVTPSIAAEQVADSCENDTSGRDAQRIARRHAQLLEGMLETALSKIPAGVGSVGAYPIWSSEQRLDSAVYGTNRDMNDESSFRVELRA